MLGPNVVTDGLVLYLDAGNTKSYPGTGTVWTDLSGGGNNGTMYGSVPFSNDGIGTFDFATATGANSANSSLGFSFASNMINTTGSFTFSCWIKNPNTYVAQKTIFSNAGGGNGYRFGVGCDAIYFLIGPDYTEGGISFTSTLSTSLWYNVVVVYSRSTSQILLYLNGVYQNLASIPASQTEFSPGVPGIVRNACCDIYNGKLSIFSAHSRSLNLLEVQQNYNSQKSRFGL